MVTTPQRPRDYSLEVLAARRAYIKRYGKPPPSLQKAPPKYPTDIIPWAEQRFYIPATGKPIQFAPHQVAILRLCFTRKENGDLPFRNIVYSTVKQSGKSTIAGVVERWYAETQASHSELYCIGNDQEQAKTRSFREIKTSIELTPGYNVGREMLPGQWIIQHTTMRYLPTHTIIRALAVDPTGEAGGKPAIQVWCVDQETECLTRAGWKLVVDLTTDDEIAALNPDTGFMHWEHPRAVNVTPYQGQMLRFKHRRVDFLVTPNHRVFGRFQTHSRYKEKVEARGWWFEEGRDAAKFNSGWLKGDASWSGAFYDPEFARMMGYFISEGHVHTYGKWIVFAQSRDAHPETYENIRQCLVNLGYTPHCSSVGLRIKDEALAQKLLVLGKSHQKYIPQDLKDANEAALSAFFDAYIEGDGWVPNASTEGLQCCTVSKRLADDLMEVALKIGYHPRLMSISPPRTGGCIGDRAVVGRYDSYRLSFSKAPIYWERRYPKEISHWQYEEYDGLVACPSVGSGVFYIRRNGKCCWTGNTEIWGVEYDAALRFWDELTPIPTIPDSIRIVETYAGYENESALLRSLYDLGIEPSLGGRQLSAGELARRTDTPIGVFEEAQHPDDPVPIYENVLAGQIMYWDSGEQARRMPWQKGERGIEYYQEQEKTLLPKAFDRLHKNIWTSSESAFIPTELWEACHDPSLPPLEPGDRTPVVIGVDAASSADCFAIVAVTRHPLRHDEIAVRNVKVWDPGRTGGRVDYDAAERFLRFLCGGGWICLDPERKNKETYVHPLSLKAQHLEEKGPDDTPVHAACFDNEMIPAYNIVQVAYDPYQLEQMMGRLRKDQIAWTKPFSQQQDRLEADRGLYDLIITKRIWHPKNELLTQHISNAGAKLQKDQDSTLRLVKVSQHRKIDAAVALSMASARCLHLTI